MSKPKPKRIQGSRKRGWRMPPNAVYVGRPSRYGNPYTVTGNSVFGDHRVREGLATLFPIPHESEDEPVKVAVDLYRNWAEEHLTKGDLERIRGKDLACWCREDAEHCHADVLLEISNREEES